MSNHHAGKICFGSFPFRIELIQVVRHSDSFTFEPRKKPLLLSIDPSLTPRILEVNYCVFFSILRATPCLRLLGRSELATPDGFYPSFLPANPEEEMRGCTSQEGEGCLCTFDSEGGERWRKLRG